MGDITKLPAMTDVTKTPSRASENGVTESPSLLVDLEQEKRRRRLKLIAIGASIAVVLLGVFLYLLLGGTKPTKGKDNNQDQEDALKVAQDMLSKKTDLTTCRAALDKVKDHLRTQQDRPPTLDAATRDFLKQRFALTDEEVVRTEGKISWFFRQVVELSMSPCYQCYYC